MKQDEKYDSIIKKNYKNNELLPILNEEIDTKDLNNYHE